MSDDIRKKLEQGLGDVLDELMKIHDRLESTEHEVSGLKAEVQSSLGVVSKSLNLLRDVVLELHKDVRTLVEDRRVLEARTTLLEDGFYKFDQRLEAVEKGA